MSGKDTTRRKSEKRNIASRRSLLKGGVATVGGMLIPSVIGASQGSPSSSEKADRIQKKAIEIRDRTGSQEKFKRFLSKHADHFQSKQISFTPKSMQSDDVSTQNWSKGAFNNELVMTYYYDSCTENDPYAYFDYNITIDSDYGSGERGPDQISIGWADHHYRYKEGSAYHDSSIDWLSLNTESLKGVDWEWSDWDACWAGCGTKEFSVGCKAELLPTDQERAAQASYWDVWEKAEVCQVTFNSSGEVEFTLCTAGQVDQYGHKIEEGGDAEAGCYP